MKKLSMLVTLLIAAAGIGLAGMRLGSDSLPGDRESSSSPSLTTFQAVRPCSFKPRISRLSWLTGTGHPRSRRGW